MKSATTWLLVGTLMALAIIAQPLSNPKLTFSERLPYFLLALAAITPGGVLVIRQAKEKIKEHTGILLVFLLFAAIFILRLLSDPSLPAGDKNPTLILSLLLITPVALILVILQTREWIRNRRLTKWNQDHS